MVVAGNRVRSKNQNYQIDCEIASSQWTGKSYGQKLSKSAINFQGSPDTNDIKEIQ